MSKRVITLGKWDGNPIEWIVLKEDNTGTLVMAKLSFSWQFNSNNNNRWEYSQIRNFLNNDFFNQAFSIEERKKIVNILLTDVGTKDNVFILNKVDAESLWNDTSIRKSDFDGNRCWLRTPRESSTLWGIDTDGCVDRNLPARDNYSFYPAMFIR